MNQDDNTKPFWKKGLESQARERERLAEVPVVLQVTSIDHAQSEEVLQFCLNELSTGCTYDELRRKLGLGPASVDRCWRQIRLILAEMVLPSSEEEQLKMANAQTAAMIQRVEAFQRKVEERAQMMRGSDQESQFLKIELDAMKLVMEKLEKQTDHYLKMKAIQKKEKGLRGPTIIFQNLNPVARPGQPIDVSPLSDAAQLVSRLGQLEDEED